MTPLLNVVNITCDTLEQAAAEIRGLEQIVILDTIDAETQAHVAKELAAVRRVLEKITISLHEERRLTTRR